ncbi:DNA polymerase III subunit gamma/tau [Thermospira aquatica]|uniref:DNA polymerase III subunit gamma/tau n=1 Tax=Thermospira aquatica TaxID=2828656 RepID=A0AAX3BB67_9SPIR|nr:DNA polymerase III subunit gamma/tau [Thermospira aquatica]URA09485.1 DNA polymerase III subunit gamma/tau [Thermospira aquatica]
MVTARKWRPQRFDALVGQEALAQALKHALQTGKIAHAYLFSGIRGVGKTSTARLLAKALNCLNLKDGEPCNICESCVSINEGSAIDVIEIDGASNRGIDAIRDLRDTVNYMPIKLQYKVYIIDEVHMLTTEASNALLKTLEEPPPHVVFILATTEVQKLLPTIRSRCQHYVFKKIPVTKITHQLMHICEQEGISYEKEALYEIAQAGAGSMRDAESIFDQVVIYTEGRLSLSAVREVLGSSPESFYQALWNGIVNQDMVAILRSIDDYLQNFGDVKDLIWGMVGFLKKGLLVKRLAADDDLLDITQEHYFQLKQLFASVDEKDMVRLMQVMADFLRGFRSDQYDRLAAELLFVQMMDFRNMIPLAEIRDELLKRVGTGSLSVVSQGVSSRQTASQKPSVSQISSATVSKPKESSSQEKFSASPAEEKAFSPAVEEKNEGLVLQRQDFPAEGEPQQALYALLESSLLTKKMPQDIESVAWDGTTLAVIVKSRYVFDYLSKTAAKISEILSKKLHIPVHVAVSMKGEKPVSFSSGDKAGEKKQMASPPGEKVQQEKVQEKQEEKNLAQREHGEVSVSEYALKLFEGKMFHKEKENNTRR